MKLVKRTGDQWEFRLGVREKGVLQHLLTFYPLRPDSGSILSRSDPDGLKDAGRLLDEALADQRTELGEWSQRKFAAGEALEQAGDAWRLKLAGDEMERLLQVLNDLRVGAWTKMGCPEQLDEDRLVSELHEAPLYAIMVTAGQFEIELLHALQGRQRDGFSSET